MAKQTFSQELLFLKMPFFKTADFRLLTSFSQLHFLFIVYLLIIFKLPGDAQKIFLLTPWTKILHQMYFFRVALYRTIYQTISKFSVFAVFNKHGFQYWISVQSQLKKKVITWYSPLHFILLKMTINSPLKWEISTAEVTLL